ncbi:MAG: DNA repair protein RecO [Candidatus Doudnabacteria bacterium]|nr:DNA repair protein RecO [Candidatus Doudnabacteria bacterium]
MRYRRFTGIILKKQNYKEADQIVTLWTKENGKIRVLARSVRLNKSKLAYSLQDLSEVEIEVTLGKFLPVLIAARVKNSFKQLRENLVKIGIAFYACELMIKMTADEHPSKPVYDLLVEFFRHLAETKVEKNKFHPALEAFTLKLLTRLGFGMQEAYTNFKIPESLSLHLDTLKSSSFTQAEKVSLNEKTGERLHQTINNFIEFILERNLKSNLFLVSL